MMPRRWCRALCILLVLCGRLAHAATEAGVTSQPNLTTHTRPTTTGAFSSVTPAPGGDSRGLSEEVTLVPESTTVPLSASTEDTTLLVSPSTENTTLPVSPSTENITLLVSPSTENTTLLVSPSTENTTLLGSPSTENTTLLGSPSTENTTLLVSPSTENTTLLGSPSTENTTLLGSPSTENTTLPVSPSTDNTTLLVSPSTDNTTLLVSPSTDNTTLLVSPSTENTTLLLSPSTENTSLPASEAPTAATVPPVLTPHGCLCNLIPDFCDIGCCCDIDDCGVANLEAVFTGCPQKVVSGDCIEKWLMFKANVNPSLVTVTDSLFCVRAEDKAAAPRPVPAVSQYPTLGSSYHFSPPGLTAASLHTRDFYRVDDVILTYLSTSSVRGLLRQPSPGAASESCINRNPAQFLRSASLSCTRTVTRQSCTSDPNLNARSYFSDLSLIKFPIAETAQVSDFLIPVAPLSDWPSPSEQNNSCINVTKNVEFVIRYTSRGELVNASVNVVLADVALNQLLSQTHSVHFQRATPGPAQGPIPAVGFKVGSPVIGRFDDTVKPLTIVGVSQGGGCSSDPGTRAPILFTHNIITGCTFSSQSYDCLELRAQIHGILQGLATPDLIAMNLGSQPNWTRVITQDCPFSSQETCESGCFLPHSLSVQVLWARQGLLDHPQNFILGAKYVFHCKKLKCPLSSPLTLTTEVIFADTTVYPQPPRGLPQPHWKFPFGFFSRGADELDYHVINGSQTDKLTWSAVLFTVILLTGLKFFSK